MVDITDGYSPLQSNADTRSNLIPLMRAANQSYEIQRQRLQQGQDIANQGYEQAAKAYNQQGDDYSALKDLLLKTQERLGNLRYSAGPQEQALRVMGAMAGAKPSLQGIAGVGAAAAQAGAQNMQESREGELMKQQLMAKYGIDAQQAGMMAHQLQAQLAQNMISKGQQMSGNASTAMNAALGRDTAMQNAMMGAQNKPVQISINGQPTPNQALISEKAQEAEAVAKSKAKGELDAMDSTGGLDTQAQAIAKYQQAPLSSFALKSPVGRAIMNRVMELNPEYEATKFPMIQSAAKEWFSGAPSSPGSTVRSMNVSMSHLDLARDLVNALDNGDMKRFNWLAQTFASETGNPAPTNFDTAKQVVSTELIKALNARGGGVTDRQEAESHLSRINGTKALQGAIDTEQGLLAGQLGGLKKQYESAELDKHYGPFEKLLMDQVTKNPITNKVLGEGKGSPPPATNAKGWVLHTDKQGRMAYVSPDGKSYEVVKQ
jgi:hypothetical protein